MKAWKILTVFSAMLACVGVARDAPRVTELDTLAKISRVDKTVEYRMMTQDQYKEMEKEYKRVAPHFPRAMALASKEWSLDKERARRPFPTSRLAMMKVDQADRLRESDRYKSAGNLKVTITTSKGTSGVAYVMPKKWEELLAKNNETKAAKTPAEAQANQDAEVAAQLVMEKMSELEKAAKPTPPK